MTTDLATDDLETAPGRPAVDVLVAHHRAFLRFLERRVGGRAAAEDLLQEAFVKTLGRIDAVPADALVPWFYTVLRHAAIDRARRLGREGRALAALARELDPGTAPPPDVQAVVCACIGALADTLKPEYAEAIRAVDLDDEPVKAFGARRGLSPSAAGVRLFRARQALRQRVATACGTCADHGCLDCSCGRAPAASAGQNR
jgi:RNA polymerase sigma factor (sigma-70 family)